jgi:hypothetical protein
VKASIYWKEIIWQVEDDRGNKFKVLMASSEPDHEHTKVTDEQGHEITGEAADKYIAAARKE